jgi:hypothetical protein
MKRSLFGQGDWRCAGQIGVWSVFLWGVCVWFLLQLYYYLSGKEVGGEGTGARALNGRKATGMEREEAASSIFMSEWDPVYIWPSTRT